MNLRKESNLELALNIIQNKSEKYAVQQEQIDRLRQDMQNFGLKIVLVGAFSAGKSALLNTFLDQNLLQENQRPETAVASELVYSPTEYLEAFRNGASQRWKLDEAPATGLEEYDFLRWHLNSPMLRDIPDDVLVDMPGFNSGIEAHNKAILQYVDQANAYVLAIDAEDGGIKQSVSEFLDEVRNYQDNLAIVITKSDLKPEEELAEIRDSVSRTAKRLFAGEVPVICTSRDDPDTPQKLKQLILQFDREKIFRQTFFPPVLKAGEKAIGVIRALKQNASLDTAAIEKEIARRERARSELSRKLNAERDRLSRKLQSQVLPAVLADAQDALMGQSDRLAESLESGGANFSSLVNSALRPVLVASTKDYIGQSFDAFISEFHFDNSGLNSGSDQACIEAIEHYREMNSKLSAVSKGMSELGGAYKAISTGLAVTTSVIAPWLELVVIFLPDILKAFSFLTQGRKREKTLQKVRGEIIPDIIRRVEPQIADSLRSVEQDMLMQMEAAIGAQMEAETAALEHAKEQIGQQQQAFEQSQQEYDSDIREIQDALNAI